MENDKIKLTWEGNDIEHIDLAKNFQKSNIFC